MPHAQFCLADHDRVPLWLMVDYSIAHSLTLIRPVICCILYKYCLCASSQFLPAEKLFLLARGRGLPFLGQGCNTRLTRTDYSPWRPEATRWRSGPKACDAPGALQALRGTGKPAPAQAGQPRIRLLAHRLSLIAWQFFSCFVRISVPYWQHLLRLSIFEQAGTDGSEPRVGRTRTGRSSYRVVAYLATAHLIQGRHVYGAPGVPRNKIADVMRGSLVIRRRLLRGIYLWQTISKQFPSP